MSDELTLIFGRKLCSACQERKKNLKSWERYIDLDNMTSKEEALLAYCGGIKEGETLPLEKTIKEELYHAI